MLRRYQTHDITRNTTINILFVIMLSLLLTDTSTVLREAYLLLLQHF